MNKDKTTAFIFGVLFCGVLAYAGLRQGATIDDRQFFILRMLAAVSAAGVAAMIPGFIDVDMGKGTKVAIRAGGALAVFVVVFLVNPPALV